MNSRQQHREKNAGKLLRGSSLIYCDKVDYSRIEASFRDNDPDKTIKTVINAVDLTSISCSCGKKDCEHLSALQTHVKSFMPSDAGKKKVFLKPEYGAITLRGREKLFSELEKISRDSYLKIFMEGAFPHLPTKWSQLKISIDIIYGTKNYRGSLGNLRQIQNKGTIGAISAENLLSLQEKQIIRFLSYNADYEGSFLILNSEKASDFFHCLPDYPNIFCVKGSLSFCAEPAELAAGIVQNGKIRKIIPVLKTKISNSHLDNASFVLGQNGAWAGISGAYFWIPGTKDVKWMRDFVRSKHEFANIPDFDNELRKLKESGLEIINEQDISKKNKVGAPRALLLAKIASGHGLYLKLLFDYSKGIFPADFSPASIAGTKIIERNIDTELNICNKILFSGFKEDEFHKGIYFTANQELRCLFFTKLIKDWQDEIEIFIQNPQEISPAPLPTKAELSVKLQSLESSDFLLFCEIRAGNLSIELDRIIKACDENTRFIEAPNGSFVEISEELRIFVKSIKDILLKAENGRFRLSKAQCKLWQALSENLENARIPEISEFVKKISKTPSNIEIPLDFKGTLRPYQIEGFRWIISRLQNGLSCLLADEMGLGKTIQSICALLKLKELKKNNGKNFKAVVLCPSSLTENWRMELSKFAKDLKVILMQGADREKLWEKHENSDLLISSYAAFKRDIDRYLGLEFDLVVLDEAQHIKNPETGNARSCKKLKSVHKLVLSGTPVENAPIEIWSIIDFLHPGILGTHNYFKKQFQSSDTGDSFKRLSIRISPIILRRRKEDVLPQLPPKTEQLVYCDMDEDQKVAYKKLFNDFREQFIRLSAENGRKGVKLQALTLLMRLRQFCCHPALLPEEFNSSNIQSAKMELLRELLLEAGDSGQKTLVFSQFPSVLKMIAEWLTPRNINFEYLDGTTKNRLERVEHFNSDKNCAVFLLSIRAGGFGINLTSAERVIIYDPWWNPAVERQAADRSHRIGQTRPVIVQKLIVKGTIEEKILELQERKQILFNEIVESAPSTFRNISMEDIKEIFS